MIEIVEDAGNAREATYKIHQSETVKVPFFKIICFFQIKQRYIPSTVTFYVFMYKLVCGGAYTTNNNQLSYLHRGCLKGKC